MAVERLMMIGHFSVMPLMMVPNCSRLEVGSPVSGSRGVDVDDGGSGVVAIIGFLYELLRGVGHRRVLGSSWWRLRPGRP